MKWKVESGTALALTDRREVKWRVERGKQPFFFFLALLLLFSSCHARKKLVSPMAHAADYEWMSAKMSGELKVESGELPFTGVLRMQRDSVIWISAASLFGMEAVRTLITNDSIVVINRLDKTYLAEPVETFRESLQTPLTLQECQSMLLGNGLSDHVELQVGTYAAKIRYSDIHWDEPTTFPIKINQNYERIKP